MRTYYYRGITCPNCHEPHVSGKPIEILDEDSLRCTSCGAKFKRQINLDSSGLFPKTIKYIMDKGEKNANQYLSHIPLMWKIEPNIIEKAYIDFFSTTKKGFFLITWPWHDVRFIPLMVFEYLLENNANKVVVIGNYSIENNEKAEIIPSSPSVFENIVYTKDGNAVIPEIKKEISKFSDKLIFEKEKVIEIKYKKIGSNEFVSPRLCYHTLRKCLNEIIKQDSEFGDYPLRNIIIHKLGHEPSTKEINKNGIWDVSLHEQERWTGSLQYNKLWLWEVLFNSTRLYPCKLVIKHFFYGEERDKKLIPADIRLHFLSSESHLDRTLELVEIISPSILVIENIDEIISDSRFGGEQSRLLLQFLHKQSVETVVMFSTNPEIRQFYKLNDSESIFQDIEITMHTWDSAHILKNLPSRNESRYPNPVSSNVSQIIKDKTVRIVPEYIIMDNYNLARESVENILTKLDDDFRKDLKLYFKRLFSTSLDLKGDYQSPEVLKVKKWGDNYLTYEILMSRLYEMVDQSTFGSLNSVLNETFMLYSQKQTNPLREKIISVVKSILELGENWYITAIVPPSEVRGIESLLRKSKSLNETAFSRISFCDWRNLAAYEREISEGFRHCIISTCHPAIDYRLHSSSVDRFVFIGDGNVINDIKYIIEKRLLEINAYPLIKPDATAALPSLLDKLLNMADIPDTKQLSKEYVNIIDEADFTMPYSETAALGSVSRISESRTNLRIKPEEYAILCTDAQNRGLFLPLSCSILLKNNDTLQEVSIDENSSMSFITKSLKGKELILGKSGFYISFKSIFFQFMMKYGDKLHFQRGPFEWYGFRNLYNDSVYWIRALEKAVYEYAKINSLNVRQSEDYISKALASSGITAINPDYITGWWTNYEEVTLDSSTYKLYRIEHPFTPADMRTIFSLLKNLCPQTVNDIQTAEKSYAAAITLQNLRRNALKRNDKKIDVKYYAIYTQLEKEIMQIVRNAELFRISSIYKIKVSTEVEALKIFKDYSTFIEKMKDEV